MNKKIETICVFGDSTAWGAWDTEKGGWVTRLWAFVAEKTNRKCEVYNLSISGGTTETILARFENEAKVRKADAIIFQSGGNDSYLNGRNGANKVPIEKFVFNVEEIIKKAKNITQNIIFVSFKNVDESKTAPVAWRDIYYLNGEIKKYNDVMEEICMKNNVLFLSIFGLLENKDIEDGLHPNSAGHNKIFEKVKDFLETQNWI